MPSDVAREPVAPRPHTGRRRNPAVREAVLKSAADLLAGPDGLTVSMDAIAQAAGVSKHTIYRWWPSKGAVLLEALVERAQQETSIPRTGTLATDVESFLVATFDAVERVAPLFRGLMAEALRDSKAAEGMREFVAARRQGLRALLTHGVEQGELPPGADLELMMDQIYGLMWYHLLITHTPLTEELAVHLARTLITSAA